MCSGVHGRVKIEQHRHILQSEALDIIVALVQTSRPHSRGSEVDVMTTVRAAATAKGPGEVVWECTNTFVFFHQTASDGGSREAGGASCRAGACRALGSGHEEDMMETGRRTLVLEANLGRVYAALCSDFNPIHIYDWAARLLVLASFMLCLLVLKHLSLGTKISNVI